MTRKDRLRRTVLLCSSFARNLAFYRVGQAGPARKLLSASHPQASFWRQANANFFDMCVLEWCKLLSDRKGEHHWSQVVSNPAAFEPAMLRHVGLDAAAFRAEKEAMRHYRDKFIAHLDDLPVPRAEESWPRWLLSSVGGSRHCGSFAVLTTQNSSRMSHWASASASHGSRRTSSISRSICIWRRS
jgi:hypothetical protein